MRWVSSMIFWLLVFGSHRVISLQLWGVELCLLGNATHVTCPCFHARKVWTQAGKRANQIWFETLSFFSGHPCMLCSLCFACCAKCYLKTALDQPRSLYAANSAPEHGCLPAWCWEVHMTFLVNQDLVGLQFFFSIILPSQPEEWCRPLLQGFEVVNMTRMDWYNVDIDMICKRSIISSRLLQRCCSLTSIDRMKRVRFGFLPVDVRKCTSSSWSSAISTRTFDSKLVLLLTQTGNYLIPSPSLT